MIQKRDDLPAEDAESGEEAVAAAPDVAAEDSVP